MADKDLTIGCTATDRPPLRGSKSVRDPGVNAMNTLKSHKEEFERGIVTESGFAAIDDAEGYGAASSIGAGSATVAMLWHALEKGESLSLFSKDKSVCRPKTEEQLVAWCKANFPACYGEFLRRSKH